MNIKRKICKQGVRIYLLFGILIVLIFTREKLYTFFNTFDSVESYAVATVIITDVENNQLPTLLTTVNSIINLQENLDTVITLKKVPYPPITFPAAENIKVFVQDQISLTQNYFKHHLHYLIKTEYIFIVSSGLTFTKLSFSNLKDVLHKTIDESVKILSIPVNKSEIMCLGSKFKYREWTVQYYSLPTKELCDAVSGNHAIFIKATDLFSLPDPLLTPVSQSLYLQSVFKQWKVSIIDAGAVVQISSVVKDIDSGWKHQLEKQNMLKAMYNKLGIKLVQGSDGKENWYGCDMDTTRCFPTVINDMPDYLYLGKWTPPCCLKHLRTTARYVFRTLEKQGVRYWLEGGSLLGAARNGDIIPWDYDIDIGIYEEDILSSPHLVGAQNEPVVDGEGFVWEKAREGKFYRVQYSASNHLHVDIFPFYSRNGVMTKDTWFPTHKQDTEFPEHYLKPLTKISFIGAQVSAPNNWTKFLEYKFGKGVITNPKYPNLESVT